VSSSVKIFAGRCRLGVGVEVMAGLWLVLHFHLCAQMASVGAEEGSKHHTDRSFVSVAETDMP
jgi:hypothetical protein